MFEPCPAGDICERKIGIDQKLLHAIDSYADDFIMKRVIQESLEVRFENFA